MADDIKILDVKPPTVIGAQQGNVITSPAETSQNRGSVWTNPIEQRDEQAQIFNMDVNYANQNKWFAQFCIEDVLGKKYKNLNLHITRFSVPQLMMASNTVWFKGYSKEVPGKVLMPDTKEITVEYIVDSNWQNYRSLYAFISNIYGTINPVSDDENKGILPSHYLPFRIFLLGPYKQKIISFLFENTWIKVFNELSLDVNQPGEVTHSFTLAWDRYSIEDI